MNNTISPIKIVVYSAAFGDRFGFIPQRKQKGIDFVCFTDNLKKVPRPWKGILMSDENLTNTLKNRKVKLNPHLYFKDYDYSVYIDSNYLITGDMRKLVSEIGTHKMGIFDHNQATDKRDCVYEEHLAILELGNKKGVYKDDPEVMKAQIDFLKSENYPRNNGLIFAAALVRKHNDAEVIKLMEDWWTIVSTCSKRDQLSFDYVRWKNKFTPYVYKGALRKDNPYFYLIGSNRRNYWKKLLQFKLGKLLK